MTDRRVLALALLAGFVLACVGPVAGPLPSDAPSATPTPPGTAGARPAADLIAATVERAPEGSAMTGVTAGGPGFVAVGFEGHTSARAWVSQDGRAWRAAPHTSAFDDASIAGVVALGSRSIAVGRDTKDVDDPRAAAWVSADGLEWRRVDGGEAFEDAQLIDLTVGGRGIVATVVAVGGLPAADSATVWTTVDGTAWRRVPGDPSFEHAFMWTVEQSGTGFIAGGWRRTPVPSAAVWTSDDGERWTPAMLPDGDGAQVRTIERLGTTLVAAGDLIEGGRALVWTSTDGRPWLRAPDASSFANATISSVVAAYGGLIAYGSRGLDAGVWVSSDGRAWTPAEDRDLAGAYITAAARSGDVVVAVGAVQEQIPGTGSFLHRAAAWYVLPR